MQTLAHKIISAISIKAKAMPPNHNIGEKKKSFMMFSQNAPMATAYRRIKIRNNMGAIFYLTTYLARIRVFLTLFEPEKGR